MLVLEINLSICYNTINIASTSKIYSKNFDNNNSFKVNNILSAYLSSIKTKANTNLILNILR